ncbi:MAG TPA: L,D-transpeptidase family protein [Longimicrobiales bacterium]|nr:L,D-transpeptidase family protein [Longimicrobiales bacterium]
MRLSTLPLLGAFALTFAAAGPAAPPDPLAGATQAVLVTTAGWDSVPGTLRRYERAALGKPWLAVGAPIPVVVGKGGLGWGIGLHGGPPDRPGPRKREGDGKAPAGVFRIGSAFGYAPAAEHPWIRLPYIHSTASWKCVDDPASRHYNQVLDETGVKKDWSSHEDMRLEGEAYRLGAIVEHNWGKSTRPSAGSCIFLHIWDGPASSTVGCTAMAPADLEALLRWLDPRRRPVLVQLPREQYDALRAEWRLP